MLVYLDNCCFNRPFDDQSQLRVQLEAEKFITLILREPFDYTKWQRTLWADRSVEDISRAAMALRQADAEPMP